MSCDMISSNPDSLSVKYSLIFYSVSLFIQLAYMKLHSLRSRLPDLTYLTQHGFVVIARQEAKTTSKLRTMEEAPPAKRPEPTFPEPQGARLQQGERPQRLVEAKGPSARSTAKWPQREEHG